VDVHLWLVHFGPLGKQIGKRWAVGDTELGSPMSLSPGMVRARPTQQAQRMEESLAGQGCGPTAIVLWIRVEVPLDNRSRAGRPCQPGDDRPLREDREKRPRGGGCAGELVHFFFTRRAGSNVGDRDNDVDWVHRVGADDGNRTRTVSLGSR
jgi:hypothetical protein